MTRLPIEIWFQSNPRASDTRFERDILNLVTVKTLLLLDRGFYHYSFWLKLIEQKVDFITRLKKGASLQVEQVFTDSYEERDSRVRLGASTQRTSFITLRLIEVRSGKTRHSYLTSVLDPTILPPYVVAELYRRRLLLRTTLRERRIEDAFNTVKWLLGLSYLWTGFLNGIQLQIRGTWLFYAVLVDLGDAVASELSLPLERIYERDDLSRSLSFFSRSSKRSGN